MPQFLQLYKLLPQYIRTADADQAWYSVLTTLGTAVNAGSSQSVTPASINGIQAGFSLIIDPGLSTQETVLVLSVGGPSFTAFFNQPHFATAAVTNASPPLAALFAAAQSQADLVYRDIGQLWQNFFVETCQDSFLPYIADLIDLNLIADDPASNRREVARTMAYRRRKGTVPQLETLAYDVTGYSARVREFFAGMIWNQCLFHFKPKDLATVNLRHHRSLARIGQAFDRTSHTADLRPSSQAQGWYNLRKLGFFLWRLNACPLKGIRAQSVPAQPGAYHFNVLGQPLPLFQNPEPSDPGVDTDWPRSTELSITSPISPEVFVEHPDQFWMTAQGFTIYLNGNPVNGVLPANLCSWAMPPALQAGQVAVDVRLGRLLFFTPPAATDTVTTDYSFGFSGDVGGGGYSRAPYIFPQSGETANILRVPSAYPTIQAALSAATGSLCIVEIEDSNLYPEALQFESSFDTLVIQAKDTQRPTLQLSTSFPPATYPVFTVDPAVKNFTGNKLILSGLLITGVGQTLTLPAGINTVILQDCTVDPGGGIAPDGVNARPAGVTLQMAAPAAGAALPTLQLTRSIFGPLSLSSSLNCLSISDCIGDATAFPAHPPPIPPPPAPPPPPTLPPLLPYLLLGGPPCTIQRSTLLGSFDCARLDASLTIFVSRATVTFLQEGCTRFCYFTPDSSVPRQYECTSDPPPKFTSRFFGDAAYTQLALDCQSVALPANCVGSPIAYGEDGCEMGVWSSLGNLRRLNHLRIRLAEYLPAGLVPLFIFET